MTRDSRSWIVVAFGAWLMSLAASPAKVERLFELDRQALVSALCELVAIIGALMKASPLPISDEGRDYYYQKEFRNGDKR